MNMTEQQRRLVRLVGCFVVIFCTCGVIFTAVIIFGMSYLPAPSIGPTFTTAESLAYDVVYETAGADPGTIRTVQSQQAGRENELHAVLVVYQVAGVSQTRLILARDNGREFFVENFTPGPAASDDQLSIQTALHPNTVDSEIAIYGRFSNPAITRIMIIWSNGLELATTIVEDTFLHFQSWSPVDETAVPYQIKAYDTEGSLIGEWTLSE